MQVKTHTRFYFLKISVMENIIHLSCHGLMSPHNYNLLLGLLSAYLALREISKILLQRPPPEIQRTPQLNHPKNKLHLPYMNPLT